MSQLCMGQLVRRSGCRGECCRFILSFTVTHLSEQSHVLGVEAFGENCGRYSALSDPVELELPHQLFTWQWGVHLFRTGVRSALKDITYVLRRQLFLALEERTHSQGVPFVLERFQYCALIPPCFTGMFQGADEEFQSVVHENNIFFPCMVASKF